MGELDQLSPQRKISGGGVRGVGGRESISGSGLGSSKISGSGGKGSASRNSLKKSCTKGVCKVVNTSGPGWDSDTGDPWSAKSGSQNAESGITGCLCPVSGSVLMNGLEMVTIFRSTPTEGGEYV